MLAGPPPLDEELSALIDSIVAGEREQQAAVTAERREAAAAAAPLPLPPGPPHRIPPSEAAAFPRPSDCAFLRPGQQWEGRQRVAAYHGPNPKQEHWEVSATVQVRVRCGQRLGGGWAGCRRAARAPLTRDYARVEAAKDYKGVNCSPSRAPQFQAAPCPANPPTHPQHCDRAAGTISGTMEARNVPEAEAPVQTFFEGEVIDNVNHTFLTGVWEGGKLPAGLHAGQQAGRGVEGRCRCRAGWLGWLGWLVSGVRRA